MGKKAAKKEATAKNEKALKTGNLKIKGENFYHNKATVQRLNMQKGGHAIRDRHGKVIKAAAFQSRDAPTARIQPDRRWFGNTRVVGQSQLEAFRQELATHRKDPYSVLLRQSRLPMSLLKDPQRDMRLNLLSSESFAHTFGKDAQRKRPKLTVGSLEEMVQQAEDKSSNLPIETAISEEEEESTIKDPLLQKGQSKRIWNELYKVVDSSDVIVHVLDARDPLGTRCRPVETFMERETPHKHLFFLLNKCDLIPPSVTRHWVQHLSRERPTVAFHASITNPFGKGTLIALLRQYAKLHPDKRQISVGFIGYPNTGKSSIINTLRKKAVCSVAPVPGQTRVWQYVTLMKRIYLIDCPGVVPASSQDTAVETVLKGVVRIEALSSPEDYIPTVLQRVRPEHLSRTYEIWQWTDATDFLTRLAVKMGKLLRGGEADISTAARIVLQDWLRGRIPYFVSPPNYHKPNSDEDGEVPLQEDEFGQDGQSNDEHSSDNEEEVEELVENS